MKIVVMSDSHGCANTVRQILSRESDANCIIFLGDGLKDIEFLAEEFEHVRIYKVKGNCDIVSKEPLYGIAPFENVLIYYTHGHMHSVKTGVNALAADAKNKGADIALFGHTHTQFNEDINGIRLFNPGCVQTHGACKSAYGVITVNSGAYKCECRNMSKQ